MGISRIVVDGVLAAAAAAVAVGASRDQSGGGGGCVRVIERCDGEIGEFGLELFDPAARATELEVLVGDVFVVPGPNFS